MEGFRPAPHRKTASWKDDCWFYYGLDVVNTSIASYILAEAELVDMHVVVGAASRHHDEIISSFCRPVVTTHVSYASDDRTPPILEALAASDVNQLDLIVMVVSDSVDVWLGYAS